MQSLRSLKNPYKASVQVTQKWNEIYVEDFYSYVLGLLAIQLLDKERIDYNDFPEVFRWPSLFFSFFL